MKTNKLLFSELSQLITEQPNRQSLKIDTFNTRQILTLINREDKKIAEAVKKEISRSLKR